MINQISLKKFNDIYDETYDNILKFVICKCSNIDDVNDIIQEIYIEVYKKLLKNVNIDNLESYIVGIAKNKIKKHYSLLYKFKTISIFNSNNTDFEVINNIHDDINIENIILENDDIEEIWKYLRNKKINIQKIFYLYYNLDFTIKEIAQELHLSESYIKNGLYRTLKELQEVLGKDCD